MAKLKVREQHRTKTKDSNSRADTRKTRSLVRYPVNQRYKLSANYKQTVTTAGIKEHNYDQWHLTDIQIFLRRTEFK